MKKGKDAFDNYYRQIFPERWSKLHAALEQKKHTVHLVNPFCEWSSEEQKLFTPIHNINIIRSADPAQTRDPKSGLLKTYQLDEASLWPALIAVQSLSSDHMIMDMCAAPGGKSLAMIFALQGQAQFHLNDMSEDRVMRLKSVMRQYLPPDVFSRVRITKSDASRMGLRQQNVYDAVLLDAPCSSERHLLENAKELEQWSPKRIQGLAVRQMGLICSALELCKQGQTFVYSTCALSPLENEELVQKFLKKRKQRVELVNEEFPGEKRAYGTAIWPDEAAGLGPIYYAQFRKN